MPDKVRIAIFLSTVIGLTVGIHVYLWLRLVRDTSLPKPWRRIASVFVLTLMLSLLSVFVLQRVLPLGARRLVVVPIYAWMGTMFYLLLALLSGDLFKVGARVVSRLTPGSAPRKPERRVFLSRLIGGAATVGAFAVTAFASRTALGLSNVVVEKVEVPLSRLPKALDGFRIAQITDLHIGPTLGRAWLEGIVARTNALGADAIVITGDLVDGSVADLRDEVAPLGQLKAPQGVYFCTGNHEYYSGAVEWCAEVTRLGIRVLRNERVAIGRGPRTSPRRAGGAQGSGETFDLAGVDDFNARGEEGDHGANLPKALRGRDPTRELVLLAHQPRAIFEASRSGVGLQLSGHTHGGQIWPWHYLVKLQQPYVSGLADHEGTKIYVSQGTGFWGPPLRVGSRSEITDIVLRSPK